MIVMCLDFHYLSIVEAWLQLRRSDSQKKLVLEPHLQSHLDLIILANPVIFQRLVVYLVMHADGRRGLMDSRRFPHLPKMSRYE